MDSQVESPRHLPLDRVGLADDLRRKVPALPVVERGRLGEPRRPIVGDPVADPGRPILRTSFEHPSIIGTVTGRGQATGADQLLDRGLPEARYVAGREAIMTDLVPAIAAGVVTPDGSTDPPDGITVRDGISITVADSVDDLRTPGTEILTASTRRVK